MKTKLLFLIFCFLGLSSTFFLGCDLIDDKKSPVDWKKCTTSSNWTGPNAAQRMMNMLSPHMPQAVFDARLTFIRSRKCNSVHLILTNKGDGEYAKYSPYGPAISWTLDPGYTSVMTARIKQLRKEGFGIILWLATDDGTDWNRTLKSNFEKYCSDIKSLGWFKYASVVVLGLEMDEYWSANDVANNMAILRKYYSGKTGVHMTSGKYDWAKYADILYYQIAPGKTAAYIQSETARVKQLIGNKPLCVFELSRTEDRALCEAAFKGGAYSVGNW